MKNNNLKLFLIISFLFLNSKIYSQDSKTACIVKSESLVGSYTGECKNGLANGKGEALGLHKYSGNFKNGFPDGKGIYYFNDSVYFSGNFQEGVKEGKGELYYTGKNKADSIIKGYWSADEYKGKKYTPYIFNERNFFDRVDIASSDNDGHTITIEITTLSGSPDGTQISFSGSVGYVLTVTEIIALDGNIIKKIDSYANANKSSITYEISRFPVQLQAILSSGKAMNIELFKKGKWQFKLFKNK